MIAPMFLLPTIGPGIGFVVIMALWMLVLIGWLYSVGSTSNKKLPEQLRKNTLIYKSGYLVTLFYFTLIIIVGFPPVEATGNGQVITPPSWFIPLHLASMFGMFYGLWFTAKQFMTLKKGHKIKFPDYRGAFFLFWFAPIGVWYLQPKINELFNEKQA